MTWLNNLEVGVLEAETYVGINKLQGAGNEYYVDPTNGSDGNSGNSATDAKATLIAGEALLEADQNDILYLIAGTSGATLAAAMTWDKSNTSLIGISPDGSKLSANNMPFITVSSPIPNCSKNISLSFLLIVSEFLHFIQGFVNCF